MLLNAQLLELDKFGTSGLQVESTSGFVGDTLLAGTHDEWHEGGRLDLMDTNTQSKKIKIKNPVFRLHPKKDVLPVDTSQHHTDHTCK